METRISPEACVISPYESWPEHFIAYSLSDQHVLFRDAEISDVAYYGENARVCAKWQWNARDCVTGLHSQLRRSCNSVTQSRAFHCHFAHARAFSLLSIHILHKRNWNYFLLMDLTQTNVARNYTFFKFATCFIALLSLGETCHFKGHDMVTVWRRLLLLSCYNCDSTRQHYDVTRFKYVLWRRTMHEWVMNIHYQTSIAQGRFINIIRTPSKQRGVCDNISNTISKDFVGINSLTYSHASYFLISEVYMVLVIAIAFVLAVAIVTTGIVCLYR